MKFYGYKTDEDLVDEIQTRYSRILDSAALNVADPIAANVGYFNNSGKVFADPTKVGKTVVFMTRPNLNLRTKSNIVRSKMFNYFINSKLGITLMRQLMYSKSADYLTYARYPTSDIPTSNWVDHIPMIGETNDTIVGGKNTVLDNLSLQMLESNFIPLVTNTCIETGNAKDIIMDIYETEGNFSGDRLQYAGGIDETMSIGEITLTFDDIYGSPVLTMFMIWIMYMHYVGKGLCDPDWKYLVHRIIDYTCSIYVFMLDTDHQTILRWIRYTGSFPRTIPFGNILHTKEIDIKSLSTVQIPFAYNFACPMDPTALTEFNMVSGGSLWHRMKKQNKLQYASLFNTHYISYENAMKFMINCQPSLTGKIDSDLPSKALDPIYSSKEIYRATNWESTVGENKPNMSLFNREKGFITNNWYGVPYIVNGNKLMWL